MKLSTLLEAIDNSGPGDWNISERDMEIVYNALKRKGELDQSDVGPLAAELVDDYEGYSRNVGSAKFLINRMHVIMHGKAPLGVSEHSAQQFFQPARPLIRFMSNRGFNPQEAINLAADEARTRKRKIKADEAKQKMFAYYKGIKDRLTTKQKKLINSAREEILKYLMAGEDAADVFGQYI